MVLKAMEIQARVDAATLVIARTHNADLMAELADLRKEIAELRSVAALLVDIETQRTEGDLATYRKRLMEGLARLTRRDPATPLH